MFSKLGWMTVQQLISYHTLIVIYRIRQSKQPEFLAKKLTHENRQGHIVAKNIALGLYRKGFIYKGSLLWNKLPEHLRKMKKISIFKTILKAGWKQMKPDLTASFTLLLTTLYHYNCMQRLLKKVFHLLYVLCKINR